MVREGESNGGKIGTTIIEQQYFKKEIKLQVNISDNGGKILNKILAIWIQQYIFKKSYTVIKCPEGMGRGAMVERRGKEYNIGQTTYMNDVWTGT